MGKSPFMAVQLPPQSLTPEELEFKAEYFHNLWIARKKRGGQHWIEYHSDPRMSPPPLRGDGKTRCNECCLLMAPYAQLTETQKQPSREIVLHIAKSDEAWRNHNG